jgi:hypothetical protein
MLKAYIEGVAALQSRKEFAYKVLAKYMLGTGDALDEAYDYAVKYLDRSARIDPAVIKTVLNWRTSRTFQSASFLTIPPSIASSRKGS